VFASTKKKYVKDQEYLSGMRDRQGHFYLQLSAGYDGPEMVINILDANAGRFPGAVTKILNELFQYLEKEYGQGQQTFRTLTVGDDASGGAWDHIATKLNANADLHRGYNVKQNAKQGVEEMAGEIHGGVRKALMAKGYKYLGSGIDKQAYVEPGTGQVLIVFGYRKGMKDFSPDQRMFIDWINYCNKNANNPHLPKFSGFESFQFGGQNYIQARMEPLRELPDEVGDLVGQLDQVTKKKYRDYRKPLQTAAQYATFQSAEMGNNTWYELEDVIEYLGGEQAAEALLQTVYQVQKFARQHRFSIDLHRGNYMQRPDGTIVVNDPFVLWLSSSGQRRSWGE
jgi:hypothetical protein